MIESVIISTHTHIFIHLILCTFIDDTCAQTEQSVQLNNSLRVVTYYNTFHRRLIVVTKAKENTLFHLFCFVSSIEWYHVNITKSFTRTEGKVSECMADRLCSYSLDVHVLSVVTHVRTDTWIGDACVWTISMTSILCVVACTRIAFNMSASMNKFVIHACAYCHIMLCTTCKSCVALL